MKKTILLRIVGCVLFLSLLLYPVNSTIHYNEGNIFNGSFTEPVEICYIIFYDGYFLRFTTYHEDRIDMSYDTFERVLKKKERKVKDIAIVIHNHQPGETQQFTDGDLYFLRRMRGDGFKGSFCLWYIGKIKCRRCKND